MSRNEKGCISSSDDEEPPKTKPIKKKAVKAKAEAKVPVAKRSKDPDHVELVKGLKAHMGDSDDSDSDSEEEPEEPTEPIQTAKEEEAQPAARKAPDVFKYLEESFDQDKLSYILRNKESFVAKMREKCFEDDYDPFELARRYLDKSENGSIRVTYKQTKGKGRFQAVGQLSLQILAREIRHTIARDLYVDIDMKNAHPVILQHLCRKVLKIDTPCLDEYIEDRERLQAMIEPGKIPAKVIVLSITNGGDKAYRTLKNPPTWLEEYKTEMGEIHKKFAQYYPEEFKANKAKRIKEEKAYNFEASFTNTLLCDYENKILMTIYKALGKPLNVVLCFDGLMIPIAMQDRVDLQNLEAAVRKALGIDITLVMKPMNEHLKLPEEIESYTALSDKDSPNAPELKLLRGDALDDDYADYVVSKYPGTFIMTPFRLYQFTGKHKWESSDLGEKMLLLNFLSDVVYKDLRKVLDSTYSDIADAGEHAKFAMKLKRLRTTSSKKQIIEAIESRIKIDNDPFDKNPNLFGFTNGIYDLEAGVFRTGRREDLVSQFADYPYEEVNQAKKREVMEFIKQIMPREDERELLLRAMASGLYNKTVQNFFVLTGSGGNGKDALVGKLYKDTLGRRHFETSTTTNLTEKRKGELSQSIANMHRKRVVIWQEPGKHSALQSATIKEITGGEYISARGIYQKSTDVEIHATCFMLCNDIPKLDSVDGGIQRRMIVIPFRSLFRSKEEIAKMVNPENVYEVDNKYNETDYRNSARTSLFHILLDHYTKFKKDGHLIKDLPQSVQDQSAAYIQDSDEFLTWFNDTYEKTDDRQTYIQAKTVYMDFKNSDLYTNLSKAAKRAANLKNIISEIEKRPELRTNYMERYRPLIDGVQKNIRNALVGYRIKEDHSDSDEE